MYAIVKSGGKQYKVAEGDVLKVEKISGDVGQTVTLGDVLALGGNTPQIGAPFVSGAAVKAEIIATEKDDKIIVFKKKRRQNYRRKHGHRQWQTTLKITGIDGAAKKAAQKADKES